MLRRVAIALFPLLPVLLAAAGSTETWHFRPSATARLSLDSNVYLQNAPASGAVVHPDAAPGGAHDVVSALSARFEAEGPLRPWLRLEGSYAPVAWRFAVRDGEDHVDHRLQLALTGRAGDWSGELRANAVITDGPTTAPVFGQKGGGPAIGGEPVRARRRQDIIRSTARLVWRRPDGFWRLAAAANDQDFHVVESPVAGCANYVDRVEWSAGLDRGWTVRPDLALVAGVRAGAMTQADLLSVRFNHSNRYLRPLLGLEGSPRRGLRVGVAAGCDFRRYGDAVAAGFARDRRSDFLDATVTWTPHAADTVTFAARRQLILSSGGRGSYLDTLAEIAWRHQAGGPWSWTGTARCQDGDNTVLAPTAPRHDRIVGGAVTLARKLGPTARLEAGLARDWGRSRVAAMPGRAYDRWVETVSVTRNW